MAADLRLTWWDRFLMGVAPEWGLRRVRARATAQLMARHYEAAAGGRRTSGWYRSASDANAANTPSLVALRELSRDLRRNNGWARRGISVISTNTVGWGIEAKAVASADGVATRAAELWKAWSRSTLCDYDGRLPFAGLQGLVMQTVAESGEALVIREPARSSDGLAIPLRIRVLEPDYLDVQRDGVAGPGGGPIVQGIELDGKGRRVAYWLYTYHPGSTRLAGARFESVRVPAENVIHVYRLERPGQMRGVPWLASAIATLNDLDDYEDAALMQQKVAACFGAFVQDLDGSAANIGEQDANTPKLEELGPGQIQYLTPGQQITFAQPPAAQDFGFTASHLRRFCASLNVTYEDVTTDYSQVNFSSARMARLAHYAGVHDWRWNMLIPQLCDGVWRWAMDLAAALEGWPEVPTAEWSPPPMPMLEPDKEGLAYTRLVRSGAKTLFQVIREQGEDPAAHLAEIAAINKQLDKLGIVLDSDPRKTTSNGQSQPPEAPSDAGDDGT